MSARHQISLIEFQREPDETLNRLNKDGSVEVLTVNGEARAVMLSPEAYDALEKEILLARDVENIRKSHEQFRAGLGRDVDEVFDELRQELIERQRQSRS